MKKYLIIIFLALLVSCQQKQKEEINSIEILYYNGLFNRADVISCDEIIYSQIIKDTYFEILKDSTHTPQEAIILKAIIKDKKVLHEIEIELNKREIMDNDNHIDARMKCQITFVDGSTNSLCLNGYPIYGIYNDQPVKFSNKFAYLIRNYCGFYSWSNIDMLKYFDELNDPSFEREKVISYTGEEY